ncbi:mitochondrial tRNA methylthiotransferase CDK5RAP1 isoform X2 [Bubalus bubalis]|uniref:mitochondrial tRNA methylthiotransferase CDK5RAP1 isoform X2 n=1 Tax=Bubalus bubalis TaxID=89462 RepID=UPI001E1B937A|nr:mitochondrial tRNA methylthiotransferase CDK5RAP1 isoform X2 [Bubalus bubalis]
MIDETVGLLSSTFSVFHTYSTANSHSLRFKRSVAICQLGVTTWFREAAEDFQSQKRPTPDAIDDALLPDGTPWTEIAAERKLRVCARSRRRRSRELAGREDSPRQEAGLSGLRKTVGSFSAMHPFQCVLRARRCLRRGPLASVSWLLLRTCRAHSSVPSSACPSPQRQQEDGVWKDFSSRLATGPTFQDFLRSASVPPEQPSSSEVEDPPPYLTVDELLGRQRRVYLETYGCQMNVNDTEIAWSILQKSGYLRTSNLQEADVILLVTCSIREKAEQTIWNRLHQLKSLKSKRLRSRVPLRIGILGCMAERLKEEILNREKMVDILAGPDAYRDLPRLLAVAESGQQAANVLLSLDETYADVMPVQTSPSATSAFVSIMRGCDNMCSYCIVPFTRGRERSRPVASILEEVRKLSEQGLKEVTLLGQNVNSFRDNSEVQFNNAVSTNLSRGFSTNYKAKQGGLRFAHLLDQVSRIDPEMRIRFTSPHPKDFPDEVLQLIHERDNICKQIHLPAQSGSSRVLEAMRRGYSREAYVELIHHIRESIPGVSLSSDFIAGFCGETEEDHLQTVSLLREVQYNIGFLFAYSMRQPSKRSAADLCGRNDGNLKVIFADVEMEDATDSGLRVRAQPGDYVLVKITSASSQTLKGHVLCKTTLKDSTAYC